METERPQNSKRRELKRREVLERKKAIAEVIKAASSVKDHLLHFPSFRRYDRNGLSLQLESFRGDKLSAPIKRYIQTLLKANMERAYGTEWPTEEKVKRRAMVASETRYILVLEQSGEELKTDARKVEGKVAPAGFVQFRFLIEEDIPVLYIYELQLESSIRGKGLGKFLMQLIELIACKNNMEAIMLTVQKVNELAANFYMRKLRYVISSVSPSKMDPLIGAEKNYEILCRTFNNEAKSRLEDNCVVSD